ncbi:MAG: hypothetical protein AAF733_02155 [Verrucomicrobiota bacterium]
MRAFPLVIYLLAFNAPEAWAWTRVTGEPIEGKPAVFLQEDKTVWFARSMTQGDGEFVAAKDLSLRDRQRLLVSPVLFESFPDEPAWPREKRNLLLILVFSPVVVLYLGFWIAGMLVTRKFNPLRALYGFLGGWFLGAIMILFYLFFASKLGGGTLTILFGCAVALVLLSLYISAVYQCDIFKGLLIFLLQLFVAGFLSITTIAASEQLLDRHEIERFWNEKVFAPVGLIENPNPFQ